MSFLAHGFRRSLSARSVLLGPHFAWKMAKTAKRAITCPVPRHTVD